MVNFVLVYKIKDQNGALDFLGALKKNYPDNRLEVRHHTPYLAFAARNLPEVEENVSTLIKNIGTNQSDYIALYYTKNEDTEKIKRLMILGPSDLAEQDLASISSIEHENLLNDLLDIDFMKLRFQNQEK